MLGISCVIWLHFKTRTKSRETIRPFHAASTPYPALAVRIYRPCF